MDRLVVYSMCVLFRDGHFRQYHTLNVSPWLRILGRAQDHRTIQTYGCCDLSDIAETC